MADYLQPVARAWRVTSIAACTFACITCFLVSLLLWTDMVQRQSFYHKGKPLWMAAVVLGALGAAAAFIAWRLVRRNSAANGVTVMPTWFIQVFGILFLVGLCFVSYYRGSVLFMAEGVVVCLAMVFIGR